MYRIRLSSAGMIGLLFLATTIGCTDSAKPSDANKPLRSLEDTRLQRVPEASPGITQTALEQPRQETRASEELSTLLDSATSLQPDVPAVPILQVEVRGAKSTSGVYSCALFDDEIKLKQRRGAIVTETFSAASETVTWTVDTLPAGEYAIAVFHDENENKVLDRHALGYPIEAYGFSNNARGKFGPPAYDKIKFQLASDPVKLKIQLK